MQLNKNVMLSIFIGVILLIFFQALIANITTPKVEIHEDVKYISVPPKEHYKIDNLTDDVIIGKYYSTGDYYFVVYNKAKDKGESRLVKHDVWESKELGAQFEKGDEEK
ncbi:MAG: hypothetical protein Q4A77_09425 [Leptotrichia hongkongensis]|nr:hypothetical protein [Leptotrichia hongkongensis]